MSDAIGAKGAAAGCALSAKKSILEPYLIASSSFISSAKSIAEFAIVLLDVCFKRFGSSKLKTIFPLSDN